LTWVLLFDACATHLCVVRRQFRKMPASLLSGVVFVLLVSVGLSFHASHRAVCNKKRVCNGNLMCAYVCEQGTVQVDSWAVNALNYQRQLQLNDQMVFYEMPSTHNSAITEANNYGIEKYFIAALGGGLDEDEGDDVGEGVCQYLTLTDQLRMGVRHVEIDIWWDRLVDDVVVCHSPVPLFPVRKVTEEAEAAGLDLVWDPKNMSCLGTKRMFKDVLSEVRDWMVQEENKDEIVMLFFDTKFYLSNSSVTKANNDIRSVFGPMLWPVTLGTPLNHSAAELLAQNKRIIIENNREEWLYPSHGDPIVFWPTLWNDHQFGPSDLVQFPNCTIDGDKSWYGKEWVRALDSTVTEAATRCGVPVVSGDYTNPDDMKLYVWSWDQAEPSSATGCVAIMPNGRWSTLDCSTELPYACLVDSAQSAAGFGLDWKIDLNVAGPSSAGSTKCPEGTTWSAPHNGYANSILVDAAYAQAIWVNAPNPLLAKV
jgi:hypothetical protein